MKRKEPTETTFTVILEKTVVVRASVVCKVKARLDRTKEKLIKNSAEYLVDNVPWSDWDEVRDSNYTVVAIEEYYDARDSSLCPHCHKQVKGPEYAIDLGEVGD